MQTKGVAVHEIMSLALSLFRIQQVIRGTGVEFEVSRGKSHRHGSSVDREAVPLYIMWTAW